MLFSDGLLATDPHAGSAPPPAGLEDGLRCTAKVRYRQKDQRCRVQAHETGLRVDFDEAQRAVAPGQFIVFYDENRCLGRRDDT